MLEECWFQSKFFFLTVELWNMLFCPTVNILTSFPIIACCRLICLASLKAELVYFLRDPGKARDCSSSLINKSMIHPLSTTALRRRHAQTVKYSSSSHKKDYAMVIKTWRACKSHHWLKSYGNITEGVDFSYWWSCIGKGLWSTWLPRIVW